jgi:hypothetical protein
VGKKLEPKKVMYAWAGFVDGRLDEWLSGFYDVEHLAIFRRRGDAQRCHEDVRRVRIEIVAGRRSPAMRAERR